MSGARWAYGAIASDGGHFGSVRGIAVPFAVSFAGKRGERTLGAYPKPRTDSQRTRNTTQHALQHANVGHVTLGSCDFEVM